MSFESLGLAPFLLRALAEQGYETPTPIQEQAIPLALEGRDLLAAGHQRLLLPVRAITPRAEPAPRPDRRSGITLTGVSRAPTALAHALPEYRDQLGIAPPPRGRRLSLLAQRMRRGCAAASCARSMCVSPTRKPLRS